MDRKKIGKRNRQKGQEFERRIVNEALELGIEAIKCGHGQSSPSFPFADVIVNQVGIECKEGKQVPNWIRSGKYVPSELSEEMLGWFKQNDLVVVHGYGWSKETETFLITLNPELLSPIVAEVAMEKLGLYRVKYQDWLKAIVGFC